MGTPVVTPPVALTIAGVDSSGGAGVAADLATFGAEGVWGACAVTAITAQNSLGVDAIELMLPEMVDAQMLAVCTDMRVAAIKTGMLGSAELAAVVVRRLPRGVPVVVDPVMVATTGARLADAGGFGALLERAALVTPNAFEVKALTGVVILSDDDMERAGRALLELGSAAALVKGGHVGQTGGSARDCLVIAGQPGVIWLESERVPTEDTHGTGCVLSAAITARLARGDDVVSACQRAKMVVTDAIRNRVRLGKGGGAVNPRAL